MANNLHSNLDGAQLHVPQDFSAADDSTQLIKNQEGSLIWQGMEWIPSVLNLVSGAVAAPTENDADRYILTGALIHASWDGCTQFQVCQYNAGTDLWTGLDAAQAMVTYNKDDDTLYGFDSAAWTSIGGGGGGGIITSFGTQSNTRLVTCGSVVNTLDGESQLSFNTISGLFCNNGLRVSGNIRMDGQWITAPTALASSGVVPIDLGDGNHFTMTLTGNASLANALEKQNGSTYTVQVTQDGVGGHALTFHASYLWEGGSTPVLPTTAGDKYLLKFYTDGSLMYGSLPIEWQV